MVYHSKIVATITFFAVATLFSMCLGAFIFGVTDCPSMHQGGVLCSMNLSGKLSIWQKFTIEFRKGLDALLGLVVSHLFTFGLTLTFVTSIFHIFRRFYHAIYSLYLPSPYLVHLFSQGILHPKVY